MTAKLLVIDNYDSFTYNLVQMFRNYALEITVLRSGALSPEDAETMNPDYMLISPGPRNPRHAGISMPLIVRWHRRIPILGVCLGMQCMNEVFGGTTVRAPAPVHGKTSRIRHTGQWLFQEVPSPLAVARYHSLMAAPAPDSPLMITAQTPDGVIMGMSHPEYPLHGVQFHPESFMTDCGFRMVGNFLRLGPCRL